MCLYYPPAFSTVFPHHSIILRFSTKKLIYSVCLCTCSYCYTSSFHNVRDVYSMYWFCPFNSVSYKAISYCLRLLFYTQVLQCLDILFVYSLKSIHIPSFVLIGYCVSELHAHLCPIIMYDVRLFIVVLQELQCLPNSLHVIIIRVMGFYHFTKFCWSTPSSF